MIMAGSRRDDGVRVKVRVKPGASRTAVGGRHGDSLVVAVVTAKPVSGKATEAVLRAVAEAFGVSRSRVSLVIGVASRDKVIDIVGTPEALSQRLDALLHG
jgi:uncharacterized protein (TIGR00251 family)